MFADPIGGKGRGGERRPAARRLQQPIAQGRIRQLVEIAQQPLDARIDQFLGHAPGVGPGIDQAGDAVQGAAVAGAKEGRPHRLVPARTDNNTSSRLNSTYSSPVTATSAPAVSSGRR